MPADVTWVRDLREVVLRPQVEAVTSWDDAKQAARFARDFDHRNAWIVERDDHRVGCASAKEHDDALVLSNLYVVPSAQGRGTGSVVVRLVQEMARKRGLGLKLTVLVASPARRLYERAGFVIVSTDRWEHAMTWWSDGAGEPRTGCRLRQDGG